MKLLLDSHSFLWFIMGSAKLSTTARGLIEDPGNELHLSAASLWEMAIKHSLGKLPLTKPFDELMPEQLALNGIRILDVTLGHVCVVAKLPFHHRDPFDRLLVAQSQVENMPVVSADSSFDAYGVQRLW